MLLSEGEKSINSFYEAVEDLTWAIVSGDWMNFIA